MTARHETGIALLLAFAVLSWTAWADFSGKVVAVKDGDTIEVLRDGTNAVTVRLAGIDAPEKKQAFGTRAKQYASDLAFGKTVTVREAGSDRYKRTLGEVILEDGRNLNQELIRAGLAWWYRQYASKDKTLEHLEAEAREAKAGLWIDADPVPPWEYRKEGRKEEKRMKTIALVNNKGGVGKTTSAVSLAAGIAALDKKVLLADLDAQGSASLSLGIARADLSPGAAEVILEGRLIREAIRPSSVKGLDILPGSMKLASADLALSDVKGREAALKNALKPILADYDFAVLDCPPSLGLLTVNALTAADFFLVPVTLDYLALEGLVNLMEAVELIRAGIGKAAAPLGFLLTLADYRLNVTEEIAGMIRKHYGRLVFKTVIPGNVKLKEAPSFGKTIFDYDAGSAGAEAYRELTKEVLHRLGWHDIKTA